MCDYYHGLTFILWNTNEPFVIASQIEQIFYVKDTKLGSNWKIMVKTQSRELYDVSKHEDEVLSIDNEPYQQNESLNVSNTMNIGGDDIFSWHRDDIPPISIDTSHLNDDLDTFSKYQSEEDCTLIDSNFE